MYIDRPVPAFGFTLYCIVLLTVLFAGRLLYKKKITVVRVLFILTLLTEKRKKNASFRTSHVRSCVVPDPIPQVPPLPSS